MGYTTQNTGLLLGLGVSSISDTGNAFAQNEKALHDYYKKVNNGQLACKKGYVLSEEDVAFRKNILDISCKGATVFDEEHLVLLRTYTFPKLDAQAADGLVEWSQAGVRLTQQGHYFIRAVCSAFDLYLQRVAQPEKLVFSKAI
jgi:oxygen-independent coproporphyrinogen-3 oxidase